MVQKSLKGWGWVEDSEATECKIPKDDSPPLLPSTFCFLPHTPHPSLGLEERE